MGQVSSSPTPHSAVGSFVNLPKEAIMSLWLSYNLLGEGWSLGLDQFLQIFNESHYLREKFRFTDDHLRNLFATFDTDNNGLIDALEFLITVGLLSAMDAIDKVNFTFSAYDFDSRGQLNSDEANLLFRSAAKGLLKASPTTNEFVAVQLSHAEQFAELLFGASGKDLHESSITIDEFKSFCVGHPVVNNWLKSVSSIEFGTDVAKKPILDGDARKEWVPSLVKPAVPSSGLRSNTAIQLTDVVVEVEEDPFPKYEPPKVIDGDEENGAPAPVVVEEDPIAEIAWVNRVDKSKPEELPTGLRNDTPEDLVEPLWIGGINVNRLSSAAVVPSSFFESRIHRNARYATYNLPKADGEDAPADGAAEEAPAVPPSVPIIYTAGNHVIISKKNEESGQWVQSIYTEHDHPISAFEIHYVKNLLVTADYALDGASSSTSAHQLVVWNFSSMKVQKHIPVPHAVKFLDISANGTLALVVYADIRTTVAVIDLQTGLPVFTRSLLLDALKDRVTDARFFGTTNLFAVACHLQGMRFFVNEEDNLMGAENMHMYVERAAIYGPLFSETSAKGASITCITRLEQVDEIAVGTAQGHILVWRGRTLSQVLEHVQRDDRPVYALDFHVPSNQLVCGGEDGSVQVFTLTEVSSIPGSGHPAKGPQPVFSRELALVASYDILKVDLVAYGIASLMISADTERLLVTTTSREVLEVRNRIKPLTPEEQAELAEATENALAAIAAAAAAASEEGAPPAEPILMPVAKGQLGEDLQGGAILTSHFLGSTATSSIVSPTLTRFNGNAFISAGVHDQTVRFWQIVGGEGDGAPVSYKVQKTLKLEVGVSAVHASSSLLAVALTSPTDLKHVKQGVIQLYALPDVTIVTELSDNKGTILDVKVSNEGNLIVAVSDDGSLYVYAQAEGVWTLKGTISLEGQVISGVDLSADNAFVKVFVPALSEVRIYDISATFGRELFAEYFRQLDDAAKQVPVAPQLDENGDPIPPSDDAPKPGAAIVELLKAMSWTTFNVPHNWDTRGSVLLHSSGAAADTYYDRSNLILASTEAALQGAVQLARIPALKFQPTANKPRLIRSTHIGPLNTLAFFDEGNSKLLTAGQLDGNIRVWKVTYDTEEPEPDVADPPPEAGEEKAAEEEDESSPGKAKLPVLYDSGEEEDYTDRARMKRHLLRPFSVETTKATEDIPKCVTSWANRIGYASTPECIKFTSKVLASEDVSSLPPMDDLVVDWIYGCTTRSTRNAVRYTQDNQVLYPAGTTAIVYNKVHQRQQPTLPHLDEITCLDYHSGSGLAVTAHKGADNIYAFLHQIGRDNAPHQVLRTWDLGKVNGVSAVAFSPDASIVVFALQDAEHTLSFYRTLDGAWLNSVVGGKYKVLNLTFSDVALSATSLRLLQGGMRHFKAITYNAATRAIDSKTGGFGGDVRRSHVLCATAVPLTTAPGDNGEITASGTEFLLGMSDGSLGVLTRGENKVSAFNAGIIKGGITAITIAKIKAQVGDEPPVFKVVVGGVGGVIKVLDNELQPLQEFLLYSKPEVFGLYDFGRVRGIKSLQVDKLSRKLLYATAANEIGELDLVTSLNLNEHQPGAPLVSAHFRDELSALATHPIRQEALTAGDDKTLRVWNLEHHQQVAILELPGRAICGAFAPNGHLIVVSLKADDPSVVRPPHHQQTTPPATGGRMAVVSYLQGQIRLVYVAADARDHISSLVFAPDGTRVFAASLDGSIYVYDALNNFALMTTLQGHNEGVDSLDISLDGRYLVSEGVGEEIMLWDTTSNTAVTRTTDIFDTLAEIHFAYHVRQNRFGLNSFGVFPKRSQKQHVTTLNQSKDAKLLATGDYQGTVHLFQNPALTTDSPAKHYRVHSAAGVQKVAFSIEDHYLLTAGRSDKMLIQWKVVRSSHKPDRNPELLKALQAGGNRVEYALPSTLPDDSFDASFFQKGLDFRRYMLPREAEEGIVALPRDTSLATLSAIQGVYAGVAANAVVTPQLPSARFCGHGEVILAQGKALTLLEDDGQHARVLNYASIATPVDASVSPPTHGDLSVTAVSPNGRYLVAGYRSVDGRHGAVELFGVPQGQRIAVLAKDVVGGVSAAAFSYPSEKAKKGGSNKSENALLAVLGRDTYHTLYLFGSVTGRWEEDVTLLATRPTSALSTTLVTFLPPPLPSTSEEDRYDFVTGGDSRVLFWRFHAATQTLLCTGADYEGHNASQPLPRITAMTAILAPDDASRAGHANYGALVTGDSTGSLHVWQGTLRPAAAWEHHGVPVTAVVSFPESGFIAASSLQLSIYRHNPYDVGTWKTNAISLAHLLDIGTLGWAATAYANPAHTVTSLSVDPKAHQVLVSLQSGLVLQVAPDAGAVRRLCDGSATVTAASTTTSSSLQGVQQVLHVPARPELVVTVSGDGGLRIWYIGSQDTVMSGLAMGDVAQQESQGTKKRNAFMHLVGHLHTPNAISSAVFLDNDTLLLSQSEPDAEGGSASILTVQLNYHYNDTASTHNGLQTSTPITSAASATPTCTASIIHRIHNIGRGSLRRLRWSSTATREYLAACSDDGCVYLFAFDASSSGDSEEDPYLLPGGKGKFTPLGFLLAHPSSLPVVDVDFSRDGRYARTFGLLHAGQVNKRSEVTYFALGDKKEGLAAGAKAAVGGVRRHAGAKVVDIPVLEQLRTDYAFEATSPSAPLGWESAHHALAPELCGVNYGRYVAPLTAAEIAKPVDVSASAENGPSEEEKEELVLWQATSVAVSEDKRLVAVGYDDGAVRVFRFPVYNPRTARATYAFLHLPGHAQGSVHVHFAVSNAEGSYYKLVTAGQGDGLLLAWNIEA